ncbi:MAG: hypothetical protein AAFV53_21145 [Myxococcota bacterium]
MSSKIVWFPTLSRRDEPEGFPSMGFDSMFPRSTDASPASEDALRRHVMALAGVPHLFLVLAYSSRSAALDIIDVLAIHRGALLVDFWLAYPSHPFADYLVRQLDAETLRTALSKMDDTDRRRFFRLLPDGVREP